jgi:hypothetical protein
MSKTNRDFLNKYIESKKRVEKKRIKWAEKKEHMKLKKRKWA